MTPFLGVIEQGLKLANTLLEGIPAEVRMANAKIWFFLWWPIGKRILARGGADAAELAEIENNVRDAK